MQTVNRGERGASDMGSVDCAIGQVLVVMNSLWWDKALLFLDLTANQPVNCVLECVLKEN